MAKSNDDLMVATKTFVVPGDTIRKGQRIVRRRDPLVKAYPDWFAELNVPRPDVEEATAEPGRKRGEA